MHHLQKLFQSYLTVVYLIKCFDIKFSKKIFLNCVILYIILIHSMLGLFSRIYLLVDKSQIIFYSLK